MTLFNKSDVRNILRAHLDTLRDNRFQPKLAPADLISFFVLPCLAGALLTYFGFHFRIDAVNGFLNVFSILTGLLLNVLVLVMTMGVTKPSDRVDAIRRARLLRETFANISFSVLVSVSVVFTALIALSYMRSVPFASTGPIATFFLCSLTINFTLTLLMVLKRMFILVDKEFGTTNSSDESKAA